MSDERRPRALSRRELGRLAALGGLGAALGSRTSGAVSTSAAPPPVKPRRLTPGDTLGLVLPASLEFESSRVDLAREQLQALGFRVKLGEHVLHRTGYLAGTDEERAADVNRMFRDPEVDGVVCHRGGWGTPRLLPLLDYEAIREQPKVLLGFSDVTALLNAVHRETGLITFHGPNGATNLRPYTLEHFRRVLMSAEPIGTLSNPPKEEHELVPREFRIVTIRGGRARGPLVGGNLTLVATLMGTPWEIVTDGRILFLEDTHEELYRIDRMLTQLSLAGKLASVAGVAFGFCTDCPPGRGPSYSLEEILHQHFAPLDVPVFSNFAFGHIKKMLTLPIGLEATIDADAGTLHFDQGAVV